MDAATVRATVISLLDKSGITLEQFVEYYRSKLGYECKFDDIRAFVFTGKYELVITNLLNCWLANKPRADYIASCQTALSTLDEKKVKQQQSNDGMEFILTRKKIGAKHVVTLITVTRDGGSNKSDQIRRTRDTCDPLTAMVWRLVAFDRSSNHQTKITMTNKLQEDSPIDRVRCENLSARYWISGIGLLAPKYLEYRRWPGMPLGYSEQYGELLLHIEAYPPPRIYFFDAKAGNIHKHVPAESKSLFVLFGGKLCTWYNTESNFRLYKYATEEHVDHIYVEMNLVMASLHFDLPLGIDFYIVGGKSIYPGDLIKNRRIVHVLPTAISKLMF